MFWPNLKLCNIPCLIEVTTLIDCCKTNTTSLYWNITYLLDTCLLGIKPSLKFQTIFIFHGSEKMCLHLSLYLYDGWWKVNTTCVDVLREAIQNINKNISNMFIEWYFKVSWPILIQMLIVLHVQDSFNSYKYDFKPTFKAQKRFLKIYMFTFYCVVYSFNTIIS